MKIVKFALFACVTSAALVLGACTSNSTTGGTDAAMAVKADNTTCPFSHEPVSAEVGTVAHKGTNVGFCCDGCAGKFAKMSDAEKDAMLAKMSPSR